MASAFASQLTSLIAEGTLDRFERTRISLIESGFGWLPAFMWRFDKGWRGLRREIPWTRPREVALKLEVSSQALLDRIEIVSNGDVLRTIPVGSREFRNVVKVKMERPGWLAVRCFEPVGVTVRYAHTSPFWFPHNGRLPVRKEDARRWADYVQSLAESVKDERARPVLREAAAVYEKLAR